MNLMQRSNELSERLASYESLTPLDSSARISASWTMCSVSVEHSESARLLVQCGNFTTAVAVLRLQFESLVRALWLLYSATDHRAKKSAEGLANYTHGKNERIPMLSEMLEKLQGKAPNAAVAPLLEFREYSWKPLSSYVHGGAHAIERHRGGYPVVLLEQAIKASNGLLVMSAQLFIVLSGQGARSRELLELQVEFADCFPPVARNAGSHRIPTL